MVAHNHTSSETESKTTSFPSQAMIARVVQGYGVMSQCASHACYAFALAPPTSTATV